MTTTTVSISNTRASLRKLAATHGWVTRPNDRGTGSNVDQFVRGNLRVHIAFTSDADRFYSAFLLDDGDSTAGRDGDGIIEDGGLAAARGWLKAAV